MTTQKYQPVSNLWICFLQTSTSFSRASAALIAASREAVSSLTNWPQVERQNLPHGVQNEKTKLAQLFL